MRIRFFFACSLLFSVMSCVSMYPEYFDASYNSASIQAPVNKVKQSIIVSRANNMLYIEAYPDPKGEEKTYDERYELALALIRKANQGKLPKFDQLVLTQTLKNLNGTPVPLIELEGELAVLNQVVFNQTFKKLNGTSAPLNKRLTTTLEEKISTNEITRMTELAAYTTNPLVTSKSKKQVPATASKAKKDEQSANKRKKQALATTSKSKKQLLATASKAKKDEQSANKRKKQALATTSKSKKQLLAAASKAKKDEQSANKRKKQALATASKSKKQLLAAASKAKKDEQSASKRKNQALSTASKSKKQMPVTASKGKKNERPTNKGTKLESADGKSKKQMLKTVSNSRKPELINKRKNKS